MDFWPVVAFLSLYYLRPHEYIEWVAKLRPITLVMALALATMLHRKIKSRELRFREFLRAPQDWAMLAFTLWLLYAASSWRDTWSEFHSLLAFYIVVEHALSDSDRMERFLWVWLGLILSIALLAISSQYGFNFQDSATWTERFKGRLVLNLTIFRNPNALGHSVIPSVAMIYYLCIWRRFVGFMQIGYPLLVIPFYCVYLTQSKGSVLSGAATLVATSTFGRPKVIQAMILVGAYTTGMSLLLLMPRMQTMRDPKAEAGVQGRMFVFQHGYNNFQGAPYGLGYKRFWGSTRALIDRVIAQYQEQREIAFAEEKATWKVERYPQLLERELKLFLEEEEERIESAVLSEVWEETVASGGNTLQAKQYAQRVAEQELRDFRRKEWDINLEREFERRFGNKVLKRMQDQADHNLGEEEVLLDRKEALRRHVWRENLHVTDSPHCSYVQVGAELGKKGLFLWLAILYYCLKSVIFAKCENDQEERVRRILFCSIITYMASSWVTNICYRATFYVQAGCVAAFHRYLFVEKRRRGQPGEGEVEDGRDRVIEGGHLLASGETDVDAQEKEEGLPVPGAPPKLPWAHTRWGIILIDPVGMYALYRGVVRMWEYIMFEM